MKTKKSWIMTLVLALLVSLLAACGKKDAGNASPSASAPSSSEPAGETAQETVKISFWHSYTDGPMKTSMDELLADFEKQDRKSTRLNSSHVKISYAVFCLKKKNTLKRQ